MTTWNDYFNQKAPGLLLGKSGVKVSLGRDGYGDPALLIFKAEFHVELIEEEARQLRDFINTLLPNVRTPGGAGIISGCEARSCTVAPAPPAQIPGHVVGDLIGAACKLSEGLLGASIRTAEDLSRDLRARESDAKVGMDKLFPPPAAPEPPVPPTGPEPVEGADTGDEEVPLPEEETPAPLNDADKSDELVASIVALIRRFACRDSGHWAYTGDIFHSRKTTESEVALGKITDVEMLRGIHADLEAAWAKLTAPPPPKKPKKIAPRIPGK